MADLNERSAAQRREKERQKRQQRQQRSGQGSRGGRRREKERNYSWLFVTGLIVMAIAVIGIFIGLKYWQNAQLMDGTAQAEKIIKTVDVKTLDTIGPGSAKVTWVPTSGEAVLKGDTGKPVFVYIGAEYCPYCAVQRWAIINSLSRFGQFGTLEPLVASEGDVPTFNFKDVKYTSQYIDFAAFEEKDNSSTPQDLQKVPAKYDAMRTKYASQFGQTGVGYPFINIADQQLSAGAYYPYPDKLIGKSYKQISEELQDNNSDIARGVYGAANVITAQLCKVLDNKPESICNDPTIQQIQKNPPANTSLMPDTNGTLASTLFTPEALVAQQRRDGFAAA
jgi:hypothetical protein